MVMSKQIVFIKDVSIKTNKFSAADLGQPEKTVNTILPININVCQGIRRDMAQCHLLMNVSSHDAVVYMYTYHCC